MAQFSTKERLIASLLSATPRLKGFIKKIYVTVNYVFYRKNYRSKVSVHLKQGINLIQPLEEKDETFFGYYDKSPENANGWIIFNETTLRTTKQPSANSPLWINIINRITKECIPIGYSFSYNWQQGSRAQWIDSNRMAYNLFDGSYRCAIYNIKDKSVERLFDYPIQDSYSDKFYLSINYSRIMRLRPDYGYRNLPLLPDNEMNCLDNDGIWKVDIPTGNSSLILSLKDIVNLSWKETFKNALHKVNHVMISPDGEKFIFIHRWYIGKQRFDRLILSNFKKLTVLADENMVSHMCWIDSNTLFGYLRHNGKNGFYYIDINTAEYKECVSLTNLGNGDGHPSVHGEWITIDTYPDKSRLQHLYLYNMVTDKVYKLLEVFQGIKYQGQSRCDLHPRFSPDGKRIYFDTVFEGNRRLAYVDISSLIQ